MQSACNVSNKHVLFLLNVNYDSFKRWILGESLACCNRCRKDIKNFISHLIERKIVINMTT
jgi:hypothetical protein